MAEPLVGKVAIVTGGGGGMGSAMSLGLVGDGADVLAVDVRAEPLEALAETARARNGPGRLAAGSKPWRRISPTPRPAPT